jgi:hypothetical protein
VDFFQSNFGDPKVNRQISSLVAVKHSLLVEAELVGYKTKIIMMPPLLSDSAVDS